jgi:hypothetical protein
MYATHAAVMLKEVVNDGWKIELNNRMVQFSKIPGECMRGMMNHVSPELLLQLDTDSHVPSSWIRLGLDFEESGSSLTQRAVDQPKGVVTEKVSFAHSFVISDIEKMSLL